MDCEELAKFRKNRCTHCRLIGDNYRHDGFTCEMREMDILACYSENGNNSDPPRLKIGDVVIHEHDLKYHKNLRIVTDAGRDDGLVRTKYLFKKGQPFYYDSPSLLHDPEQYGIDVLGGDASTPQH